MPDLDFFNVIEPLSLEEIADIAQCEIKPPASKDKIIKNVAPIESATNDDLTFLSNAKYADSLKSSKAGACILHNDDTAKAPEDMALLISKNPYASYAKIAGFFYPHNNNNNVSDQAYITSTAKIGNNCNIEAGAFIGDNAQIGDNCHIASGAYINKSVKIGHNCTINNGTTLSHTIIGNNVIIHPGVRIGQDGFGFATDMGVHIKVPQLGRVIIEDNVEIGANSCIDRGAGPDTIIGAGTKIDNLVQIAHNVQTGKGCIIVSQVGISGSTKLGDYVVLGGQVGVTGHLNIGNMANAAAQSGVMNDIADNQTVGGSPAVPIREWHKQSVIMKRLIKKKNK